LKRESKIQKLFSSSGSEIKLLIREMGLSVPDENIVRVIRLIKKLKKNIPDNSLIVDIGAFDGKTSLKLSKAFPLCKIFAFEPNPEAYSIAANNCAGRANITLNNIAISDKNGSASLNVTSNKVSSSLNTINKAEIDTTQKEEFAVKSESSVETKTLDSFSFENILLLKIDTQGHEMNVLEGAKNTLKQISFILVEMNNHSIYSGSSKYFDIDNWLRSNNFQLADIIVTYRKDGILVTEFDAIYFNSSIHLK
jgi:FkbM family methyltransferase